MAPKRQITNKGLELMASSSKATGQHWWLGWYAFAYVPDELQEEEGEKLSPAMTKLTKDGDIIYNIFQGDMNGDGYQTTKASSRFKSVNYDSNIKKNYRYVIDEDGRNNLVTFVDGKHGLKGACVYKGVQVLPSRDNNEIEHETSKIPLPAPLLYTGVLAAGEGWSTDSMEIFLGSGSDSIDKFYPVDEVKVEGTTRNVPRVSTDFRNYEGYKNGLEKIASGNDYDNALGGEDVEGVDFDGWFPAVNTYTQDNETDMGEDYNQYCKEYWKVLSISNFNKYCAPVNASGLVYDENTGCRNMAKATKYFPISDYSVTSTAKTEDNEYATGIKLHVELKLNGNAEDGAYFKEVETSTEGNVATLNPTPSTEDQALFNTQKVSFKFNRIGIYAVPMRQYGCSNDSSEMTAQFQIDTEAEPVLFAVCEWDSPVTVSDSGEGLSEFQSDILIDLSASVDDSSVIRESAVFYNLYEDDAIDWYKNQLVANASIAEALVNMQIEMGYLRNQKNAKQGCCPKQEAIQPQKTSTGLRNLVDAKDYNSNSVRNRLAQVEGVVLKPEWSDVVPKLMGIGYPHTSGDSRTHIYARKATVTTQVQGSTETTSTDVYSAFYADACTGASYSDAEIDENIYANLATDAVADGAKDAVQIGGRWVRTNVYYELFSFQKNTDQPNLFAYDYDDSLATNDFIRGTGDVTDYIGTGSDVREIGGDVPYITITMTPGENNTVHIETKDGSTVTQDYPSALNDRTEFVAETNRLITPYETKRVYTVYYTQDGDTRDYDDYKIKRVTSLSIPKTQLYLIDADVYTKINNQLTGTGWRIPTTADWGAIMGYSTPEKISKIRSSSKWGLAGGTGGVYPLGGGVTIDSTTSIDAQNTVIYLAIFGDTQNVVKFDGTSFSIIPTDSVTGLTHVSILCVADANQLSEGTSNYKLGYDSYALMEGSISAGSHNFNAGEKSSIFESANYNSIFGGMYNKVSDSAYNAVLNGYHNELTGAVFSVVFGDNNVVKAGWSQTCRSLVAATNSVISRAITSEIFAERSTVQDVITSSIFASLPNDDAEDNEISNIVCSRFTGQVIKNSNSILFSDILAYNVSHLPNTVHLSRMSVANDKMNTLPPSLIYWNAWVNHSDFIGSNVRFFKKTGETEPSGTTISFSRFAGGGSSGSDVGIIDIVATYSDIFVSDDGKNKNSWCDGKTLETVSIAYSAIKMAHSSITSAYIGGSVRRSNISFFDIGLSDTFITMSEDNGKDVPHVFSFGVMKLSHSVIAKSDCSYVLAMGTRQFLTSAQLYYSTLFGNDISLTSSNYIKNTHIYGSLQLTSNLENHIILAGLSETTIGESSSASSYIYEFGSCITSNYHKYPMIWSMGGLGLFMNKMVLGDKGVTGGKAPSIGDVLSVVGVEGNMATVAWKSGGAAGGGSSDIIVFQDDGVMIPYKSGAKFMTFSAEPVSSATAVRYSLFQDGEFTTYTNGDVPLFKTPGGNQPYGLRPNGTNHIVWNTWYSIKEYSTFDGDADDASAHVEEIKNGISGQIATGINKLSTMVVVTNALVDGLVYEVTINIRANAACAVSETGTTVVGEPVGNMYAPGRYSTHFGLAFYKDNGENPSSTVTTKRWADSANSVGNYIVYPRFVPAYSGDDGTGFGPGTHTGYQAPVLATAKVYFVQVGEDIFIMAY